MDSDNTGTALTVQEIMEKYAGATVEGLKRGDESVAAVVVLPEAKKLHSVKKFLDEYRTAPERRTGTAQHFSLESLIAHVNRFKDADSALFANPNYGRGQNQGEAFRLPSITAVLDYHRAGAESDARFGLHRAVYEFPLSDEWKEWHGATGGKQFEGQQDFAEFIERNIDCVFAYQNGDNPKVDDFVKLVGGSFASPSKLMELARGIQINATEKVEQRINPSTGEVTLVYVEEHTSNGKRGGSVSVPNLFMIAIPVFLNGPVYQVIVRLRYRLRGGSVKWSYDLFRADKVFESAFDEACKLAEKEMALPVFQAIPEPSDKPYTA